MQEKQAVSYRVAMKPHSHECCAVGWCASVDKETRPVKAAYSRLSVLLAVDETQLNSTYSCRYSLGVSRALLSRLRRNGSRVIVFFRSVLSPFFRHLLVSPTCDLLTSGAVMPTTLQLIWRVAPPWILSLPFPSLLSPRFSSNNLNMFHSPKIRSTETPPVPIRL